MPKKAAQGRGITNNVRVPDPVTEPLGGGRRVFLTTQKTEINFQRSVKNTSQATASNVGIRRILPKFARFTQKKQQYAQFAVLDFMMSAGVINMLKNPQKTERLKNSRLS